MTQCMSCGRVNVGPGAHEYEQALGPGAYAPVATYKCTGSVVEVQEVLTPRQRKQVARVQGTLKRKVVA